MAACVQVVPYIIRNNVEMLEDMPFQIIVLARNAVLYKIMEYFPVHLSQRISNQRSVKCLNMNILNVGICVFCFYTDKLVDI